MIFLAIAACAAALNIPDLVVDTEHVSDTLVIIKKNSRKYLHFEGNIRNNGTGPFSDIDDETLYFTFSLLYAGNSSEVPGLTKTNPVFCIQDKDCEETYTFTTCSPQGVSPGCMANCDPVAECHSIDVTDLPNGNYTLRLEANPGHLGDETNFANNEDSVEFALEDVPVSSSSSSSAIIVFAIFGGLCLLISCCACITMYASQGRNPFSGTQMTGAKIEATREQQRLRSDQIQWW